MPKLGQRKGAKRRAKIPTSKGLFRIPHPFAPSFHICELEGEQVEVNVEIQGAAVALHKGNGSGPGVRLLAGFSCDKQRELPLRLHVGLPLRMRKQAGV